MPTLSAPVAPAVLGFALLCRFAFRLPPALAMTWWGGLHTSRHRTCTYVVRRLDRYRGRAEGYGGWFLRTIPAQSLVGATERLYEEGHLSRKDATTVEEVLFGLMTKGDWK